MASAESADLEEQKRSLRRDMTARRARLGPADRAKASAGAVERLLALPELRGFDGTQACVAGFVATRAEIDPAAALDAVRGRGARVVLPRVTEGGADRPRLRLHVADPGDDLRPGRFGIAEPDGACPEVRPSDVQVMIVPGLAFDRAGHRLGFGGGYYDELLGGPGGVRPACVIGLGYDFQVVDTCPAGGRDARVDVLVTDARVIRCAPDGTAREEGPS